MLEAKLSKAGTLKKILDALKDLVNEASWDCSSNGISLQAMDCAHVALVAVHLQSKGFEKYYCDRNITLGLNLVNLSKILKCAGNDDSLCIKAKNDDDKVSLTFVNKENRVSEYEMKLLNLDADHMEIPVDDSKYCVTAEIASCAFQKICKDLAQIGDAVKISCQNDSITFLSNGDLCQGKIILNDDCVKLCIKQDLCLSYGLNYLNNFTKATPLSSFVTVSLSSTFPLSVDYIILNDDEEFGCIRYFLAPKLLDD
ncbi:proliferating cell nuclear antigen-like protein [Leptotrombidium deliense]|uniref:DNA sliding clamp PCNA n=1 Tax=Leptotrombidium deliense TaxID=299467 RepID=A0A443S9C1_9ACAR|nr:proliferating cell nuclear antigen-like protein [Leptotrombidium deliense]